MMLKLLCNQHLDPYGRPLFAFVHALDLHVLDLADIQDVIRMFREFALITVQT